VVAKLDTSINQPMPTFLEVGLRNSGVGTRLEGKMAQCDKHAAWIMGFEIFDICLTFSMHRIMKHSSFHLMQNNYIFTLYGCADIDRDLVY
jgi:hypothetical protein